MLKQVQALIHELLTDGYFMVDGYEFASQPNERWGHNTFFTSLLFANSFVLAAANVVVSAIAIALLHSQ